MKPAFFILFLSFVGIKSLFAQNPFLDGIKNTFSYKDESTDDYYSHFKAIETGTCTFEFNDRIFEYDGEYDEKYTWSWVDITSVKLGENMLELSSEKRKITVFSKNVDTGGTDLQTSWPNVYIFFSSADAAKTAGKWVIDKVKACGGDAVMVQ